MATDKKPDKQTISPGDRLLVDAEALAHLLSCSARHIQSLDASGRLPMPIRLGRRTLWDVAGVRRWCAAGCPPRDHMQQQDTGVVTLCEEGRADG
jgi:predicted DNA-binding transcriptional regulator AlpA